MSYEINPCKSVRRSVQGSDCDINNMSDLCYGIARGYGKAYGRKIQTDLEGKCGELISEKKHTNGYSDCYMKRPSPPPDFYQTYRSFPHIFKYLNEKGDNNTVEIAYKKCCDMCRGSRFPNTCVNNCGLDAGAISSESVETYDDVTRDEYYKDNKREHPVVFFIGFVLVVVVVFLFMLVFIRGLMRKNI